MKILEITKFARQIIKQLESVFTSYGTYGSEDDASRLVNLINEYEYSDDADFRKQCVIYRTKLFEILIRALTK